MSTGGGTTTTSTTQQSAPWAPAQPYLSDLLSQAQQTYNNSQGQTAYPDTVAGFSPQSLQAMNATAQRAMTGSPLLGAADQSVNRLLNPGAAPGTAALQSLARGYYDPGNAAAESFANPNNINPYLGAEFSAASQPVTDAVNAQFGLAGRTGSGANQQELTRNLGQLAANIYGSGYDSAANRALTASGQLSNNSFNQAGVMSNAANALNSQYNNQNNQSLAAAGLAPQLASQDYTDLQNLLNVGGAYDAYNQNVLNNQLAQWQYAQQQPWNILQSYGGAITGLGALGGTSSGTNTQTAPRQSLIPSLIGAGAGLALAPMTGGTSLLGSFF
jgi:hypothetical protein